MRQRLMRFGEPHEHFEVLAAAEPVAQPFGFVGPHAAEARPQRLDQFHLVAQIDDALAQRVQIRRRSAADQSAGMRPRALR